MSDKNFSHIFLTVILNIASSVLYDNDRPVKQMNGNSQDISRCSESYHLTHYCLNSFFRSFSGHSLR